MKKEWLAFHLIISTCLFSQTYKLEINFKNGSSTTFLVETLSEIYFDNIDTEVLKNTENAKIISGFLLFQNYPNPFNPSTTVKYLLNAPNDVNLSIYSITGEIIKTLSYSNQPPGEHMFVWDGYDQYGKKVSSGPYLYKLTVGNETKIQRMILLR